MLKLTVLGLASGYLFADNFDKFLTKNYTYFALKLCIIYSKALSYFLGRGVIGIIIKVYDEFKYS